MSDDLVQRLRSDAGFRKASPIMREAADEIVRLQAERKDHLWLLKGARLTLDAIVVGREGAAHAEAQAQRIVDHIGHGVTDEPPHTLVENETLRAEVERLQAELERHREVSRQAFMRDLQGLRDHIAEQAAEVVRLQQALRDDLMPNQWEFLLDHVLDSIEDKQAHRGNTAWLEEIRAFLAARAVLNGDQQ